MTMLSCPVAAALGPPRQLGTRINTSRACSRGSGTSNSSNGSGRGRATLMTYAAGSLGGGTEDNGRMHVPTDAFGGTA